MRQLRPHMADTIDIIDFYDGTSIHRTAHKLDEISGGAAGLGYPVSGDDLALATYEGEPK